MAKKNTHTGNRAHKQKKKKERQNNRCPFCGGSIQMVPFSEMGFRFEPDHHPDFFWRCAKYPQCDAYIGAHPKTKKPAGTLANPAMRYKRIVIHKWAMLLVANRVFSHRSTFASSCASILGYRRVNDIHISSMSNYELDTLRAYFKNMYEKNAKVHRLVDAEVSSVLWKEVRGLNETVNRKVYDKDGKVIMDKYEEEAMAMMEQDVRAMEAEEGSAAEDQKEEPNAGTPASEAPSADAAAESVESQGDAEE